MIFAQLEEQLIALKTLLDRLSPEQYNYQCKHLGGASIGGHTRHILELIGCAVFCYDAGVIDYQNRVRDMTVEVDKDCAIALLEKLVMIADMPDKAMQLSGHDIAVPTSYYREVVYNIEHTIHHLALIKVSLLEMEVTLVDQNFGMAYSTIKYKQQMAAQISA